MNLSSKLNNSYGFPINLTEVLTPSGWKLFKDINVLDSIMSANSDMNFEFKQVNLIADRILSDVYEFTNGLIISPNNNIYYVDKSSNNIYIDNISKVINNYNGSIKYYIPISGIYNSPMVNFEERNDMIMIIVGAIYYREYVRNNESITLRLRNNNEKELIMKILDTLNVQYKVNDNTGILQNKLDIVITDLSLIDIVAPYVSNGKFEYTLMVLSDELIDSLVKSINIWDNYYSGNNNSNTYYFESWNSKNLDVIMATLGIHGYLVRKDNNHLISYKKCKLKPINLSTYKVMKDKMISSVDLDNDNILIRQNGRLFICPIK